MHIGQIRLNNALHTLANPHWLHMNVIVSHVNRLGFTVVINQHNTSTIIQLKFMNVERWEHILEHGCHEFDMILLTSKVVQHQLTKHLINQSTPKE